MRHKEIGKSHRNGISLANPRRMFPDDTAARMHIEEFVWPECRRCPHCGTGNGQPGGARL
ncbi:MAG: transposase [Boseongicola sp. SB0662_bin_57]|nr:transposase [Boseongicola sp. SB0662_bin_57]